MTGAQAMPGSWRGIGRIVRDAATAPNPCDDLNDAILPFGASFRAALAKYAPARASTAQ